tara:strand:- start:209 stop:892 length:684 start_codon:yes stop_codon:yes gene_type:complete
MFNTGFSWLRDDVDMVDHTNEPYGDKVNYISQSLLDADSLANKISVINIEDVEGMFVAPLIGSYQAGVGNTDADFDVYGCVTQGLPMQSSSQGAAMVTLLGTIKSTRVNGGAAALLDENQADVGGTRTSMDLIHPITGTVYQSFVRAGEATNELNGLWMATTTVDGVDPEDLANLSVTDRRGAVASSAIDATPFCYIPGLSMFQKLVFTCNMGSLACKANALIAKVY